MQNEYFIEVTNLNDEKLLLNLCFIAKVAREENGCRITLFEQFYYEFDSFLVKDSYIHIKNVIKSIPCGDKVRESEC